jgi:hypothetical protein
LQLSKGSVTCLYKIRRKVATPLEGLCHCLCQSLVRLAKALCSSLGGSRLPLKLVQLCKALGAASGVTRVADSTDELLRCSANAQDVGDAAQWRMPRRPGFEERKEGLKNVSALVTIQPPVGPAKV